ncbi:tripartite tricarboxylate transporter substrate binding protein [Variovorax sp. J22R133]|uniref:Bug family tripartite tricarboxylate transporter substrate binding protein n=1 Tax=Variovorax brevis TaxID=3053503 RepID=UPI002576DEA1|nr:tripartite tricarboxylate transporter substrate binding protein [Variovorax sp. J22R133]MDM0111492.1 tripartite tricarboxylate transporter substrate binding protein [Variovorax sp. J22R133]
MPISSLRVLAAAAVLSVVAAQPAWSADYPNKPVKIVVPYAAGGSTDTLARVVAERLGKRFGQAVVVDNKPGASEQIAITSVTKAAPDGYTLLISTLSGLAVNPGLYGARIQYNPQKDLAPIVLAATVPSVVVVHPSVPVKNMKELGAYLKSKPGEVSYGSAGAGTPSHLGMEYYKKENGFDPVHVPYKGGAPALNELMGGQVQMMMALVPEAMPMVKSGRMRALAVTTTKRLPAYPDLPTVAESGGKDFDMTFWYAFMAPAGTPPEIIAKLNEAINGILAEKDVRARLDEMSLDVVGGAPTKVTELIKSDSAKWKKVIDEAGIKVD